MRHGAIGMIAATILLAAPGSAAAQGRSVEVCIWTSQIAPSVANVSVTWGFSSGSHIRFAPDGMYYDNSADRPVLTPAQLAVHAPVLDELRAAAMAGKKVTINWDDASKRVSSVYVLWTIGC